MPVQPDHQIQRRVAIMDILRSRRVTRQADLVRMLAGQGFHATQSSVSRDLKDLGVSKNKDGYVLPETESGTPDAGLESLAVFVRWIRTAGANLTVIGTAAGAAQRVALSLDRAAWPEIAGTVSGDDTIFVATADRAGQRLLLTRLRRQFKAQENLR